MTKNRGEYRPNVPSLAAQRTRRKQNELSKGSAPRSSASGSGAGAGAGGSNVKREYCHSVHCNSRTKNGTAPAVGSNTAVRIATDASSGSGSNSHGAPDGGGGAGTPWDDGGEEWRTVVRTTMSELTTPASDIGRPVVLPPRDEVVSAFFSVTPAAVSVTDYVARVLRYAQCSSAAFLYAAVYLTRLQEVDERLELNAYNMHRLLITAVMIGAKFVDDAWYSNAYYARVGGVATVAEMNKLEMEMLKLLNFRLLVSHTELNVFLKKSPALVARL